MARETQGRYSQCSWEREPGIKTCRDQRTLMSSQQKGPIKLRTLQEVCKLVWLICWKRNKKHSMGRQEKLSVPPSLTRLLLSFPRWASSRKWEKYFPLKQEIHFGYYKKHCTFAWRDKRTTCSLRKNRHLWDLCNVSSENPCPNAVGIKSMDDRMQSLLQIMPMQSRTNTSKEEKEAINIVPPTSIGIGITILA